MYQDPQNGGHPCGLAQVPDLSLSQWKTLVKETIHTNRNPPAQLWPPHLPLENRTCWASKENPGLLASTPLSTSLLLALKRSLLQIPLLVMHCSARILALFSFE